MQPEEHSAPDAQHIAAKCNTQSNNANPVFPVPKSFPHSGKSLHNNTVYKRYIVQ